MRKAVAILSADWHLRTTTPCSRAEKDWFAVMEARMNQIKELQSRLGGPHILVSGDLFDRHDPPSSLVTWCMEHLPKNVVCIPGQHDLLGHAYSRRTEGAYGALVKSGHISDLAVGGWAELDENTDMLALPWGHYGLPETKSDKPIRIIMLHKYVWATVKSKYVGAEEHSRVTGLSGLAEYASVVSIGDNHIAWKAGIFHNHGSLFCMTSAQKEHTHYVGIVYSDGSTDFVRFPESSVEWVEVPEWKARESGSAGLVQELETLESDSVSFEQQLRITGDRHGGEIAKVFDELRASVFG